MNKDLTIIIPAYNEEKSLELYLPSVIEHCENKGYQLIIVNDGSKDKTLEILNSFAEKSNILQVVSHKVNKGYGGAIKTGIKAAATEYVITIDADGQHYLEDVDKLFKEIVDKDADMIIGSRKGQKSSGFFRGIGKFIIRKIAQILLPFNFQDLNSGMKIYNTTLAKKYLDLCPNSMAYSDTIVLVFINYRHLVLEIPISIKQRTEGKSTIGIHTAIETVKEIINLVFLFNPLKIFFPLSVFIFLISLAWAFPIILRGNGLSVGALLGIMLSVILLFLGLVAEQISLLRKKTYE